jgi:hypothetical protein
MTKNNDTDTNDEVSEKGMTPKELANHFGTDPKTVRKFLRSIATERPGKGGRWTIPTEMLPELEERFAAWNTRSATVLSLDADDDES